LPSLIKLLHKLLHHSQVAAPALFTYIPWGLLWCLAAVTLDSAPAESELPLSLSRWSLI